MPAIAVTFAGAQDNEYQSARQLGTVTHGNIATYVGPYYYGGPHHDYNQNMGGTAPTVLRLSKASNPTKSQAQLKTKALKSRGGDTRSQFVEPLPLSYHRRNAVANRGAHCLRSSSRNRSANPIAFSGSPRRPRFPPLLSGSLRVW